MGQLWDKYAAASKQKEQETEEQTDPDPEEELISEEVGTAADPRALNAAVKPRETFGNKNTSAYRKPVFQKPSGQTKDSVSEKEVKIRPISLVAKTEQAAAPSANPLQVNCSVEEQMGAQRVTMHFIFSSVLPDDVKSVLCFVRSSETKDGRGYWVDKTNALQRADGYSFPNEEGPLDVLCSFDARQEERYYVTMFLVHNNDSLTELCKKTVERPLLLEIRFEIRRVRFGGERTLYLDTRSNRPLKNRPALILCVSQSGKYLTSPDSSDARPVLSLGEKKLAGDSTQIQEQFRLPDGLKRRQQVFLFGSGDTPMTIRWADGFNGLA